MWEEQPFKRVSVRSRYCDFYGDLRQEKKTGLSMMRVIWSLSNNTNPFSKTSRANPCWDSSMLGITDILSLDDQWEEWTRGTYHRNWFQLSYSLGKSFNYFLWHCCTLQKISRNQNKPLSFGGSFYSFMKNKIYFPRLVWYLKDVSQHIMTT